MPFQRIMFLSVLIAATSTAALLHAEDKKIFSGPQVGEKLPPLKVKGVFDKEAGKDFDYAAMAGDKPAVLIFMHKLTRPSAAVMRAILTYTGKKKPGELFSAMVYLTGDLTEGEKRLKRAQVVFRQRGNAKIGISPDGAEGPGAYGLNRNMTLTILVADKGKVTANFPLVQPSVQADVLKVVKEVVKLTGDKMPALKDLFKGRYAAKKGKKKRGRRLDPQLGGLLRAVIRKDAKPEEVDAAVKKVNKYVEKKPAAKAHVGRIARRIVNSGRLKNYGTKRAQEYLTKWAKEFKAKEK